MKTNDATFAAKLSWVNEALNFPVSGCMLRFLAVHLTLQLRNVTFLTMTSEQSSLVLGTQKCHFIC